MFKKLNSNNKGFSLVELLVAVAILGIVSGIILNSFSSSSKMIMKSKQFGEATGAAQNIASVVNVVNKDSFISGNAADVLNLTPDDFYKIDGDSVAIKNLSISDSSYDVKVTYNPGEENTSEEYLAGVYELNDYEIAKYTEMDCNYTQPYSEGENPDIMVIEKFNNFGSSKEGEKSNPTVDRCIVPAKSGDNYSYTRLTRLVSVNVYYETDPSTGLVSKVFMNVVYNYTFTFNGQVYVNGTPTGATDTGTYTHTFEYPINFNHRDSDGKFDGTVQSYYEPYYKTADDPDGDVYKKPNVYINYFPYYDSKKQIASPAVYANYYETNNIANTGYTGTVHDSSSPGAESYAELKQICFSDYAADEPANFRNYATYATRDLMYINNLGNLDFTMFIVKQHQVNRETGDPEASLTQYENNTYKAYIIQRLSSNKPLAESVDISDKTTCEIYTNAGLKINPLNPTEKTGLVNFTAIKIPVMQAVDVGQTVKDDLVTTEDGEDRFYAVTIDVYKAGSFGELEAGEDGYYADIPEGLTPIYTFNGSKLDR